MTEIPLFLQNFALFKLSDQCEHYKFYYLGELINEQLLQPPIYSEGAERKSKHSSQIQDQKKRKKWSHQ